MPLVSATVATTTMKSQITSITPNTTLPCRRSRTMRPKAKAKANGMMSKVKISRKFVMPLGFSNGWMELALRKPPPFVPRCLMAIWLAAGPPGIDCSTPSSVVTVS